MASTLVESLSGLMAPDLIGKTASSLGESTAGISKATNAAFSSLLAGVLGKGSSPGAMDQLYRLIASPSNDGSVLNNVGGLVSSVTSGATSQITDLGSRFLSQLFGAQVGSVTGAVGQYAGIRNSSASMMLGMVSPLVLGALGRAVRTQGLNAGGLREMLSSEKDSILSGVPSALTSMFGMSVTEEPFTAHQASRAPGWQIPAALAVGVLFAWLVLRPNAPELPGEATAGLRTASEAVSRTAKSAEITVSKLTLPGGREIDATSTGIETGLLALIQDGSKPLSNTTWFDFDRIRFDSGSARVTAESHPQIENVAAIMSAYPGVRVKIAGYTDHVEEADANLKLSRQRALNVRHELIALGVSPNRMAAEGYGEEHPLASNATEAGRAQDRSIALQVIAR